MKKVLFIMFLVALCSSIQAQSISVRGSVISADDQNGMPGVNVVIKGTTQGTVTNLDGSFQITVPSEQSVLRFSSVGFVTEEIVVGNQRIINLTMDLDAQSLEEVVVVGYGEQRKASIVGAVSNVRNEELKRAAPSNLTAAIGGRVTGALVRLGDGNVGGADARYDSGVMDDAQIFIRGRATTNTATPLILVDGVESSFNRINPEDVEQFSVLKDASATAIYGVRGANGVILITTKQGTVGKPKITLNGQLRFHQSMKFPRPLRAYDRAVLMNEAYNNVGQARPYTQEDLEHWRLGDDPYGHPDTDWYGDLVKDFFLEEQYNVNITGGTDMVRYFISGEYNHAGGPWDAKKAMENNYKRYNLRTNFDFKFTKTTELSVKLNGRMENRGDVFYGESTGQRYYGSFWYGILARSGAEAPIRNPNGTWAYGSDNNWNLRAILDDGGYRVRMSNALDANLNLRQKLDFILPGLSARVLYGSIFSSGSRRRIGNESDTELWRYYPESIDTNGNVIPERYERMRAAAAQTRSVDNTNLPFSRRTQLEFALNYENLFAEKHRVTAMVLASQSSSESDATLPVSYRGLAGRITYAYKSKYLLETNMAYNGSDQFDKNNRYALFPSLSAGWVISEEKFWKDHLGFIDFLKIRGSYGLAGNDKLGNDRFLYRSEFNAIENSDKWTDYRHEVYNFGLTPTQYNTALKEGRLGNDKITWEVSRKTNLGADFRIWKSRIRLTADVFYEYRDNILATRGDVPLQTGLTASLLPPQNIREISNRGYEFELSYSDTFGEFDITIGGNYTFARSKIEYAAEASRVYKYQQTEGYPVNQPMGYIWTGKFYDPEDIANPNIAKHDGAIAGDLWFKDLNGDGKIDEDGDITRDREIGFTTIPEIIYGINTYFGFKGFYLDLFWQGATNISSRWTNEIRYEFYSNNVLPFHQDRWAFYQDVDGKWIDTRETAKYPILAPGGRWATTQNSSFQYIDCSYLRLKTAEFGYNFPKAWLNKLRVSALRVFLSGSNLLTFDNVGFVDPEYNPEASGRRGNSYPQTKFYAVGLNVTF